MIVQNSIFPATEETPNFMTWNEESSSMWSYMQENFDLVFILYISYA